MYSLILIYSFIQHSAKFIEYPLTKHWGKDNNQDSIHLCPQRTLGVGVGKIHLLFEMTKIFVFAQFPFSPPPCKPVLQSARKGPLPKPSLNFKFRASLDLFSSDLTLFMFQVS